MRRSICTLTLAVLMALPGLLTVTVDAADHREAPLVDENPSGDITDVFAFLAPNDASRLILALVVNPFSVPGENPSYSFSPEFLYQFKIDNDGDAKEDFVVQVIFDGTGAAQTVEVRGPGRPKRVGARNKLLRDAPTVEGATGQVIGDPKGVQVFAGLRDDSFVFDVAQFFRILRNLQDVFRAVNAPVLGPLRGRPVRADGTSGVDTFGGFNTSALIVSFPKSLVQGATSRINIWATVSHPQSDDPKRIGKFEQFERMGQAVFATVFVAAANRDAFNAEIPTHDVANFSSLVPDTLTSNDPTGNTIADRATLLTTLGLAPASGSPSPLAGAPLLLLLPVRLTSLGQRLPFTNTNKDLLRVTLLPDVIRLELSLPLSGCNLCSPDEQASGLFGLENGRRPQDDVVDIALRLLRQLADVKFPDGSGVPGSGALGSRKALDCSKLPSCPDRRVLVVLQGTDFIKPDSQVADVSTSGTDQPFLPDFPFFATPHPLPGEPGTIGFPPQQ